MAFQNPNGSDKFCDEVPIEQCTNKEYARLKQENEELEKKIQAQKGLITVGGKQQYKLTLAYDKYRSALEEISLIIDELKQQYDYMSDYSEIKEIENKINEVLNDTQTN